MDFTAETDYACQCDPQQPKTRRPRPKKDVAKKPDPKVIFEQAKSEPKQKPKQKPPKQKPAKQKQKQKPGKRSRHSRHRGRE
jgi:hypothetical protein